MANTIWEHLSPEDDKKARKSLLIVAAITIFAAGIEITSDEISTLGFAVRIPQSKMISAGQLLSGLMLIVFLARSMPVYVQSFFDLKERALQSKQEREELNLQMDFGLHEPPDYDGSPASEFEKLGDKHDIQKKILKKRVELYLFAARALSVLVVDYSVPILVGFIAFYSPEYPSQIRLTELMENTEEAASEEPHKETNETASK